MINNSYSAQQISNAVIPIDPVIGDELSPTPLFSNSNGVTALGGWTISGGNAVEDSSGAPMVMTPAPALTMPAGTYVCVSDITAGGVNERVGVYLYSGVTLLGQATPAGTLSASTGVIGTAVVIASAADAIKVATLEGAGITLTALSVKFASSIFNLNSTFANSTNLTLGASASVGSGKLTPGSTATTFTISGTLVPGTYAILGTSGSSLTGAHVTVAVGGATANLTLPANGKPYYTTIVSTATDQIISVTTLSGAPKLDTFEVYRIG